jgi:hypothetical protein
LSRVIGTAIDVTSTILLSIVRNCLRLGKKSWSLTIKY